MASTRLAAAGVESARLEAQMLACHVLLVDRPWLVTHRDEEFPDLAGEQVLQRRERREPLAYILGWREFYGRRFRVDPRVLIPRQETETIIEALAARCRASGPNPSRLTPDTLRLLDIGTGSGIIAITLKLEIPQVDVTAVDISPDALEVAQDNARHLGADVRFLLSDGFTELSGESFDVIVTNPPYIATEETLMPEVAGHEPHLALFSGETGMEFYERLAQEARDYLNDGGRLLMEVGHTQARTVAGLFERKGWRLVAIHPDLSGVERVVEVIPVFECAL